MQTPYPFVTVVAAIAGLTLAACEPDGRTVLDAGDLSHLDKYVAFYPHEVGLLTDPALELRLSTLMGEAELAAMQANWQTEGPIVREQDVISATGCMDNNCAGAGYFLFIDLAADNINVYSIIDGELTNYDEEGPIQLPFGLESEFAVEMDNRLNLAEDPESSP